MKKLGNSQVIISVILKVLGDITDLKNIKTTANGWELNDQFFINYELSTIVYKNLEFTIDDINLKMIKQFINNAVNNLQYTEAIPEYQELLDILRPKNFKQSCNEINDLHKQAQKKLSLNSQVTATENYVNTTTTNKMLEITNKIVDDEEKILKAPLDWWENLVIEKRKELFLKYYPELRFIIEQIRYSQIWTIHAREHCENNILPSTCGRENTCEECERFIHNSN